MTVSGISQTRLYVALVHYPVLNKHGEEIASAITNLDLHDIARVATTYGVAGFYVVTPLIDQQELAASIVAHWISGYGAVYNAKRKEAFANVWIKDNLDEVIRSIQAREGGCRPCTIATTSRTHDRSASFRLLREKLAEGHPHLLLFGTAWGLVPRVIRESDMVLQPICGPTAYNHLSVRGAAAIILDRLLGLQ